MERDRICISIEVFLRGLEKGGADRLKRAMNGGEICLTFGRYSSRATNEDIALLRLAMSMRDDLQHGAALRRVLEE
jgi:hypothetical protein